MPSIVIPAETPADAARFWSKVEKLPDDGCWLWVGARKRNGYGQFKLGGRPLLPHRIAYAWACGPIPDSAQLDHLCRNRACVNPAHLEPVTNRENALRGEHPNVLARRRGRCRAGLHDLTDSINVYVSSDGRRYCRACMRDRHRAWIGRHPGRRAS